MTIFFNQPYSTGRELEYIQQAMKNCHLSGDGPFTDKCHAWLQANLPCRKALLTHSGTHALEMAAILLDIEAGDEVIMPSFTFVSTANAFVLRGGVPVFIDIRPDTLNLDEKLLVKAITARTKAIVPVHYAGVACEMDTIMEIAKRYKLAVVEDAAHGMLAFYCGKRLGAIGDLAALSFHETKNIICGEGGALIVNDDRFVERAEIIREKGTNRSLFYRGEVDKYRWVDVGSSFLPSELQAAYLWAQLEESQRITEMRRQVWQNYYDLLEPLEREGFIRRPQVPDSCSPNGHLFYILVEKCEDRDPLIGHLKQQKIFAMFHYVPLHSSPGGARFARIGSSLSVTEAVSDRLLRLPFWNLISLKQQQRVVFEIERFMKTLRTSLSVNPPVRRQQPSLQPEQIAGGEDVKPSLV